jgi:CRISPR-associated protein Cas2
MRNWYLVSYDVREERRLRLVARKLEGYGVRLQYSVFRCFLTPRSMERMRWELSKILLPEDDLLILELCASCISKVRSRKGVGEWPEQQPHVLIV